MFSTIEKNNLAAVFLRMFTSMIDMIYWWIAERSSHDGEGLYVDEEQVRDEPGEGRLRSYKVRKDEKQTYFLQTCFFNNVVEPRESILLLTMNKL